MRFLAYRTDDERREVAARLRALNYGDLHESLICAYLDALGIKGYEDWIGIAHRLADLIEPPMQCPHYHSDRHHCSVYDDVIDRDALLALADELEEDACWEVQTPGDTSGAWRLKDACDRIREACGVTL